MKRVIFIYIGAIVGILCTGLLIGHFQNQKKQEIPDVVYKEVIVGYDEDGNAIKKDVPQNEVSVKIDGKEYTCNIAAYKNGKPKIEDVEFSYKPVIGDFLTNGFEKVESREFKKGDSTIIIQWVQDTGRLMELDAFTESYNNITAEKRSICKNFELPCGIILGKSTFDDVQRVYGASVVYDFYNSKKTKYYLSDSIADGSMTLFFDTDNVLCGIVMTFDYLNLID